MSEPPDDDPFAFPLDERDVVPESESESGSGPESGSESGPRPPVEPAPPVVSPPTGRYMLIVVLLIAVVAGVSILALNRSDGGDSQVRPGERLPDFAAPLAGLPKLAHDDINLAQRPHQGQAGNRAACSIVNPSVVTSCGLLRRGPLVLMMFSRRVAECVQAVDTLEALRPGSSRLQTLAVAIGGHHDDTTAAKRSRGWRLPVAYDADGALASRLGAAVCPLVLFVGRDGIVQDRIVGQVTPAALRQKTAALLAANPRPATSRSTATTVPHPAPGR